MAKNIKEIGKELLGKSLNSYHRRTGLTQLEENNKMQDGILDGILSQVDDAYIEKTEQSNVIHLDGSGDGVVVVDSIEGNTMVNLFDNDKITNSNVTFENDCMILQSNNKYCRYKDLAIKPNATYTLIIDIQENTLSPSNSAEEVIVMGRENGHSSCFNESYTIKTSQNGLNKYKLTTKSDFTNETISFFLRTYTVTTSGHIKFRLILLEGDWTNK